MRWLWSFLAAAGLAWAQPPELWTPLTGLAQMPSGSSPLTVGCRIGLAAAHANHLTYQQGPWGALNADLEETRLELRATAATPAGEFGLYLPIKAYWGGFLDPFLDGVHTLLNLPTNIVPFDTQVWYQKPGQNPVGVTAPVLGLGDAVFSFGRNFDPHWWGRALLSVPTGTPFLLTGGGGFRAGLEVGGQLGDWSGSLMLSAPLSSSQAYSYLGLESIANVMLKLRWDGVQSLLGAWSPLTGLQVSVLSAPFSAQGVPGEWVGEIHMVLNQFTFREDLSAPAPDVVLGYWQHWGFADCP